MKFRQLYVEKYLGRKGTEYAHHKLQVQMETGALTEVFWTGHARRRAQQMVRAGFEWEHVVRAVAAPTRVVLSPTYNRPIGMFGGVSVPLMVDAQGRAIAVTVLPSTRRGWEMFYASGEATDREVRTDFQASVKKERIDQNDGKRCCSCLTEFNDAALDSARVTSSGTVCVHCYNLRHPPSSTAARPGLGKRR